MNLTKDQLEKIEKEAMESLPKAKKDFLKAHGVKSEKEFSERYKNKVANSKKNN